MMNQTAPTRAILCGLEQDVAHELRSALGEQDVRTEICPDLDHVLSTAGEGNADVVFCSFSNNLLRLLKRISVPVVVVSRHPEVNQWLDALEAGAADYCAAPFEDVQLRWILQSNCQLRAAA